MNHKKPDKSDSSHDSALRKEYPCDTLCDIKCDIQNILDLMGPETPQFAASSEIEHDISEPTSRSIEITYNNEHTFKTDSTISTPSESRENYHKSMRIKKSLEKREYNSQKVLSKVQSDKSSSISESDMQDESSPENKRHSNISNNIGVTTHPTGETPTKDDKFNLNKSNENKKYAEPTMMPQSIQTDFIPLDDNFDVNVPIKEQIIKTSTINEDTFRSYNDPEPLKYCECHDNFTTTCSCNTELQQPSSYLRVCSCVQENTSSVEVNFSDSRCERQIYEFDYSCVPCSHHSCQIPQYERVIPYIEEPVSSIPISKTVCDKRKYKLFDWIKPKYNTLPKNIDLYKMKEIKVNSAQQLQRLVFERIVTKDPQEPYCSDPNCAAKKIENKTPLITDGINTNSCSKNEVQNSVEKQNMNIPPFRCIQQRCSSYFSKELDPGLDKSNKTQDNEINKNVESLEKKLDTCLEINKNNISTIKSYHDTSGTTRIDVYYFDHGNTDYYCTTDSAPSIYTEMLAEKTEMYTIKFWANMFGTIHIGFSFITSFLTQLYRFVLYALIRPMTVGLLQLSSDYFLKPFLSTLFNSFIQPVLIFIYNIVSSIRDICDPIAASFGYFIREGARCLKAFRFVEINSNNTVKKQAVCEPKPITSQPKSNCVC